MSQADLKKELAKIQLLKELAEIQALKEGKRFPQDEKERRRIERYGEYVNGHGKLVKAGQAQDEQVIAAFLQYMTSHGLDPDTCNSYVKALREFQQWWGRPLATAPDGIFPLYLDALRQSGQPIENAHRALNKFRQFQP